MDPWQHQAPNQHSGHYQASQPYPPQQRGQYPQHPPNTYNDRPPSHHAHSPYPEGGSSQHPPSGQGYGGHSPYAGTVPFPEPHHHGGPADHQQAYVSPSQTMQFLPVPTHQQHGRRASHGHSPTGSYSDSQGLHSAGAGSDTGGGSNFYPLHGYTATTPPQPQDWNSAAVNEGLDSRLKAPPFQFSSGFKHTCRYPHCNNPVFLDKRVGEYREWCSDQHMQAAIARGVEKACHACGVWPRRNGSKYCSGKSCRNPNR